MTPMLSVFEADQSMEVDIGCCREDLSWSSDKQSCTWDKQYRSPTNGPVHRQHPPVDGTLEAGFKRQALKEADNIEMLAAQWAMQRPG